MCSPTLSLPLPLLLPEPLPELSLLPESLPLPELLLPPPELSLPLSLLSEPDPGDGMFNGGRGCTGGVGQGREPERTVAASSVVGTTAAPAGPAATAAAATARPVAVVAVRPMMGKEHLRGESVREGGWRERGAGGGGAKEENEERASPTAAVGGASRVQARCWTRCCWGW